MKTFLKIHRILKRNIITVSIVLVLAPTILILLLPNKKYYPYQFEGDVSLIPFTTDNNGYMYVRASFNDTTGIFFVDTGSDISGIKESLLNKKDTVYRLKLTDAQKIQDRKKMIRARYFKIGEIEFPHVKVWPIDKESWQLNGFLFKKDNVVGVIGSDILSHFICEFDMENRQIVLHKSDDNYSTPPDSSSIPLKKRGKGYFTEIEVDSIIRIVKFDSGCSGALLIQDSLLNSENNFKAYSWGKNGGKRTFFSHLKKDTLQTDTSFYCMIPKLSLGIDTFRSVICQEKAEINLLGVPFFWSYEKVIADYPNKKVYFLNKKKEYSKYDIQTNTNNFIKNTFLNKRGTFRVESKSYERYDVMFVSKIDTGIQNSVQDTIPSLYKIYGESRWWGKNVNNIDSILCMDSVLLPNGKIADNNYIIFGKDKYFHNN